MSDEKIFYTRVIVHGRIPAQNAGDALATLCDLIRTGIGPEMEGGRSWDISISAGAAGHEEDKPEIARINEDFVRRILDPKGGEANA